MGKPKVAEPPPPLWSNNVVLAGFDDYEKLAREYRQLTDREKADKARKSEISKVLQAYHTVAQVKKASIGEYQVIMSNGSTASQLSVPQLLLAGVDADIIAACKVAGTPYTYIQVIPVEEEPIAYDNG